MQTVIETFHSKICIKKKYINIIYFPIDRWLTNYPELIDKIFSKIIILESIKDNNNFYFNDIMLTQVCGGTAMGTKFAPT